MLVPCDITIIYWQHLLGLDPTRVLYQHSALFLHSFLPSIHPSFHWSIPLRLDTILFKSIFNLLTFMPCSRCLMFRQPYWGDDRFLMILGTSMGFLQSKHDSTSRHQYNTGKEAVYRVLQGVLGIQNLAWNSFQILPSLYFPSREASISAL